MPHPVTCGACNATFLIPDEVWDKRVHGQVATLKCRQCKAPIEVDGRVRRGSAASIVTSATASPAVAHPDPQPAIVSPQTLPGEAPQRVGFTPDGRKSLETKQPSIALHVEPAQTKSSASEFGRFDVKRADPSPVAKLGESLPVAGARENPANDLSAKKLEPVSAVTALGGPPGAALSSNRKLPERSPTRPALPSNVSIKAHQDSTPKPRPATSPRAEAKLSPTTAAADKQRGAPDLWVVSFGADDDRELSTSQLRDTIAKGLVTRDTIVWREGMTDWLPIGKLPELAQHLRPEQFAKVSSASKPGKVATSDDGDDETIIYKPGSKFASAAAAAKLNLSNPATQRASGNLTHVASPKNEPHDVQQERPARSPARSAPSLSTGNVRRADASHDAGLKLETAQRPTVNQAAAAIAKSGGGPPPLRRTQPSRPEGVAVLATQSVAERKPLANDDVVTSVPAFDKAPAAGTPPPLPVKDKPEPPAAKPAIFPPAVQSQPQFAGSDVGSRELRATPSFAPRPSDFAALTKIRSKFPKWLPFAVLGGLVLLVAVMAGLSWLGGDSADADRKASPNESAPLPGPGPLSSSAVIAPAGAQKDSAPKSGDLSAGFANKFAQAAAKQRPTARFDRDAAEKALAPGFAKAAGCHNKGEPTGSASVTLSIGPSGQVLSVTVAPPFATTFTAECIRNSLREITVPPFQGSPGRLAHSITIH